MSDSIRLPRGRRDDYIIMPSKGIIPFIWITLSCWLSHSNVPLSDCMVDLNGPFVRKAPCPFQNLGQTLHYCFF